ncbi:transcriptional factor B3 family protein [Arabidopsis lyrata subsp. lyrata]|uniref:Transcriptional factor B3 family protein n=1 Tax=Arabidopsis lyrata subsp. lyrata TaxID=81972 RepID=D7MXL5_ARALL|nr:B3 domain-containing protein At2g35310 isoform X1 [Arabidopsis lyrata subsp. lyrata]EFH38718.1 transcriptional factor B3 family protein [Arabidopsis lyrata subsp. lyrata]|eukprot:XP_020891251.1 B3 domain-containing protein At2g35310 isoform X1 [Arabidopsis lyrata subsp. lyrata]
MARNSDYDMCKEERKRESFFKVLQRVDFSSENLRALPYDFVRSFSNNELSGKMKIKAQWGSSWEVEICKNPRFYFMEKSGWVKFVRDNALGDNEFLTFTHKGTMRFTVNIFKQDGKEMLQPPQSMASMASSRRRRTKTEQGISYLATTITAESNGGENYTRKLNFEKKKAAESQNSKRTEKVFSVRRDSAGASSSSVAEFTIFIKKSYLIFMRIPKSVQSIHMPMQRTIFKIHQPNMKKSWNVVYLVANRGASFSGGWKRLAQEYPVAVGDTCKFSFIKQHELILFVSKP